MWFTAMFTAMAYVDTIAEACLRLSLPSVCSVQDERTEYRTYVNTWYVLRLEITRSHDCVFLVSHS